MVEDSLTNNNFQLLSYVQSIKRRAGKMRVGHFHMSRMDEDSRKREDKYSILTDFIHETFKGTETRVFVVSNMDIFVVSTALNSWALSAVITKLLAEFGGDNFLAGIDKSNTDNLVTVYDLYNDYNKFLNLCLNLHRKGNKEGKKREKLRAELEKEGKMESNVPTLTSKELGSIENFMMTTNIASVLKQQAICHIDSRLEPDTIFREIFVSIASLAKNVSPDHDIMSNKWLFMQLTCLLDKRVLGSLRTSSNKDLRGSVSINLNVPSVLTKEFDMFDSSLRDVERETIMIEFQVVDIISDINKFEYVNKYLQEKGYRVCVDSIQYETLPILQAFDFEVDAFKLNASGKLRNMRKKDLARLVKRLDRDGSNRYILCRCDDSSMVHFGLELGINVFQGRYVDTLIKKNKEEKKSVSNERVLNKGRPRVMVRSAP